MRRLRRDEAGVSVVELLVVMVITVVVGGALLSTVSSSGRAERTALDLRENTDRARVAVERIRDVVRAGYGVCDGSDASRLSIWAGDLGVRDRRIAEDELIHFELADGQLFRQDGTGGTNVVAFGLDETSRFEYVDRDQQPFDEVDEGMGLDCDNTTEQVEGRGDIGAVQVRLAGLSDPSRQTPPTVVDTTVMLRNAAMLDGTINPNRPPIPLFTVDCDGLSCLLDAGDSYDEDGDVIQYRWSFPGSGVADHASASPTHSVTFPSYVSYQIQLQVVDNEEATASTSRWVNLIADGDPPASFEVHCPDLTCHFDASATVFGGGNPADYSFSWLFGDGTAGSGMTTFRTYDAPGTYAVILTVQRDGRIGEATQWANPTDEPDLVRVVSIEDISTGGVTWTPKVQIRVQYPNGANAHRVSVHGRFGPSPETANDLKTNSTNALGLVSLQANGATANPTFFFHVTDIPGKTLDSSNSTLSITLTRPGS